MAGERHSVAGVVARLEELTALSQALSAEPDPERLTERILEAAQRLTNADGGTLYRMNDSGDALDFHIARNESLNLAMGGSSGNPVTLGQVPLRDSDGEPDHHHVASHVALTGQTINIVDAYAEPAFDFSGTRAFDGRTGYRSHSFLTLALRNNEGQVIGVLELINACDPTSGEVTTFSEDDRRFAEALASHSAVVLTQQELIGQQRALFEALIRLIARAIDEKSEHTGAHCQRVPPLTMMIADAAHAAPSGSLADFQVSSDERYELEIAAWLHDCGKVSTPEPVMDKATKLHGMYDRIGDIATRFELVKRDTENAALSERLAAASSRREPASWAEEATVARTLAAIDADRAFLEKANEGGESMAHADQSRVHRIASAYRWRDAAGGDWPILNDEETANLCIERGTLNEREREIMKDHARLTLEMLEALPYPQGLRQVPDLAGGHHERMDGGGYPRGLVGRDNPCGARMMVIADVFEALTASDRPYKQPNTLSEALKIMGQMNEKQHFDPDLFDVFIRQRVYERYAERYMQPFQLDAVDETSIPGYTP